MVNISGVLELEGLAPVDFYAAGIAIRNLSQLFVHDFIDHRGDD